MTLDASVAPVRVAAGGVARGRVRLVVAEGWHVNAHRPGPKDLAGLTVSVLGEGVVAGLPHYPDPSSRARRLSPEPVAVYAGETEVTVDLRVPSTAHPGARRVRFRVAFQACRGDECAPPESVVLEAPFEVAP